MPLWYGVSFIILEDTVNEIMQQAHMTTDIQNAINQTKENVETVHKTTVDVMDIIDNGIKCIY